MITAKMLNTLTDLTDAPIPGVAKGDLVTIVAVRGESVEVETQSGDRFVATNADVLIDLDLDEMEKATALIDFTLRLAALPRQFADLLERGIMVDNLVSVTGETPNLTLAKVASGQIFTLQLLAFLSLLGELTAQATTSKA